MRTMLDTVPPRPRSPAPHGQPLSDLMPVLVVLWSADEPWRVGEVLMVPPASSGQCFRFGRSQPGAVQEDRLELHRQRPGLLEPAGSPSTPTISRHQLELRLSPAGDLQVENTGQCPLWLNDTAVSRADLQPGDLLELQDALLFLCVRRPAQLAAIPGQSLHPFGEPDPHGVVGESPAIWELRRQLMFLARRGAHVLILGPSGTGKELVARALHALSGRGSRPLIARNAATIPEGLIDAELFGNIRHYPNAGMPERPGLIGEADGSTLFLDEIGELPDALQAHLLRVLDLGEYQRLGEATVRRADLRLLAATNRSESSLKHDLLARLKLRLTLPGLGERLEDIPLLARQLLRRMVADDPALHRRLEGDHAGGPRLSRALTAALIRHPYTSHVRELETLLWRALAASHGDVVEYPEGDAMFSPRSRAGRLHLSGAPPGFLPTAAPETPDRFLKMLDPEPRRLLELLRRHRFNLTHVSRDPTCAVTRSTLDVHLRLLLFRALADAGWRLEEAVRSLAGGVDPVLEQRLRERIETTLDHLRLRLEEEGESAVRERLAINYRAGYALVEPVLEALKAGRL